MESVADVEMPSPKRLRVEAPNLSNAAESTDYVDDFSDIYDSKETNSDVVSPSTLEKGNLLPENVPDLPTLPGLPGLSTVNPKTAPTTTVAEVRTEQAFQNDPSQGIEVETKNAETDVTQRPEEQGNSTQTPLTKLDKLEDAAHMSNSNQGELTSTADGMDSDVSVEVKESKISTSRPEEAPSASNLPPQVNGKDSFEDPLAFLEASLGQDSTPRQEAPIQGPDKDNNISVESQTFEDLATTNKHTADAEFELDSSPLNSDSDSGSSDDTTSSDDSDGDDYELLGAEEQARRLMAEDGGSDDEGGTAKEKAAGPLRTQNEKPDEVVPKPDVTITEEMKIEELGSVEGMVENVVVIKAQISGEYQVLEQGSVLCLEHRSVIGVIAETLGRVQQPYYSVRFTNAAAIAEAGIAKDTKIFYVEQMSTPVFTQPLRAFKGSDASNLHDEEIGDDELEFSDDEAEAEHKRQMKMQRLHKRNGREGQIDGFSKGPRGGRGAFGRGGGKRGGRSQNEARFGQGVQEQSPIAMEAALNYDDNANEMNVDGDDLYTPLARPTNLHEIMGSQAGFSENLGFQRGNNKPSHGRGRGRGDRRGDRASGHGRGQGRGGFGNRGGNNSQQRPNTFLPSPLQQSNGFPQSPTQQSTYPPPQWTQPSTAQSTYPPPQWAQSSTAQFTYPPPQWTQSPTAQYPQQQYSTDAYQIQQQYQPYQQPTANTNKNNNNIPAGAHINPLFFPQPQQWPQQPQ